ncbi:MAG: SPFH domain-containing protein [Spirochaetales bacterium]|nr:SPFH domain-containing protein [Spirochaetales bacterium]
MGLFDKLKGEFIDIIEWIDNSQDTIVYKFERYNNEIKNGAKLIVRESQVAIFMDKGKIADVFEPGMYELETENLPILSTLQGWKYGFKSPFKADVFFVSTKRFTDLKWGTTSPIMLRDPEFGPIRIRARGNFSAKVENPSLMIKEIAGTSENFTTEGILSHLRTVILTRFSDLLGEAKIPALDLAAQYDELSNMAQTKLYKEFLGYGIDLRSFHIENITLPDSVNEMLDKRTSMGIVGDMQKFTQFQTANAIGDAANNPSGMAAGGMGMGMGFAMANQMAGSFANQNQGAGAAVPPPIAEKSFFVAVNGQQTGPFNMNLIQSKIASGEITGATLVWTQGMAQWAAAESIPEMTNLFKMVPPPIQ